ncbi:GAF domain-containing protein [Halopolyspora algeriensis]|uniref:GAF domain-containing protein n=1 Tax=Halopolyspora algeriensis TaxID=1500506 RepID=A0A368VEK8_9ACTN|nr:GAF domain-containing protein [Halopolyspora algeriensis]RCW39697.1 GAF domain-containing protein [Halopolyspora algeriensis]TQM54010.1 GAF domain-containing protein [Halopolyspora algeriensis]
MAHDHAGQRLVTTPGDPEAAQRMARLRALGIGTQPDQEFDEFASTLAQAADTPYAMVNFITESHQYFAGLHTPSGKQTGADLETAQATASTEPGRRMPRDHGFCPHVVARRLPLVLDDVCEYPRFAGNPVVDEIGIRSYLGAPLIDRTGTSLGTICAIATEARPWGRPGLETIKTMAAELMELIHRRETRAQS